VAEYVLIRIRESKREVITETWKELQKKRRNMYFTRYVVTAIKFKMNYEPCPESKDTSRVGR
jgi:RAB protein geranylgeranyltransferase component A